MRVFGVVGERRTVLEAKALIEAPCRFERRHRPGFKTQARIGAPSGLGHDMLQQRPRHPVPSMGGSRAHGFDFAAVYLKLFESSAAKQLAVFPNGPKGNFGPEQRLYIERMNATAGKIIIDGNSAAALGCMFAGCTVVTWFG